MSTLRVDNIVPFSSGSTTITLAGTLDATASYAENSISSSYALTASYALNGESTDTSSLLVTASATDNVITFTKGDSTTFTVTVDTGSAVTTDTGSLLVTASVSSNTITFTKGDSTTFDITVDTGSATPIDTGSFATTGSNTFNGNQIISGSIDFGDGSIIQSLSASSGDGSGLTTLTLKPDTSNPSDQYIVLDPTSPNHIHIRAGGIIDSSSAYLYLGGEKSNVVVRNLDNSFNEKHWVQINSQTGSTQYTWTFDDDGTLSVPGDITGAGNLATTGSNQFNGNQGITGSLEQGSDTRAIGNYSHAEGLSTKTGTQNAYYAESVVNGVITLSGSYDDVSGQFGADNRLYLYDVPFDDNYGKEIFIVSQSYFDSNNTIVELYDTSVNTTTAYVGDLGQGVNNWTGDQTIPGDYSHAEGNQTQAIGNRSHAEGFGTLAIGNRSHAEGYNTQAIGQTSHAEGAYTQAIGDYSHAEGNITQAIGEYSHAEGDNTQAIGNYSHAEGQEVISVGNYSHAEGYDARAIGNYSHAEGAGTKTGTQNAYYAESVVSGVVTLSGSYGDVSSQFGVDNRLYLYDAPFDAVYSRDVFIISQSYYDSTNTIVELYDTSVNTTTAYVGDLTNGEGINEWTGDQTIPGNYSHTEGELTQAIGESSHAEGYEAQASGYASHAEGNNSKSIGFYSHAEGESSQAIGIGSHAEGAETKAIGDRSHAEGQEAISSGSYSHAEGYATIASGSYSHAEGYNTQAIGGYSHAEGESTTATGLGSHAEGAGADAIGNFSHAEGNSTQAIGFYSHAEGFQTQAIGEYSHAEGQYVWAGSYQGYTISGYSIGSPGTFTLSGNRVSSFPAGAKYTAGPGSGGEYDILDSTFDGSFTYVTGSVVGVLSKVYSLTDSPIGNKSHAEGNQTISAGDFSHAEGQSTQTIGGYSHAEGNGAQAIGLGSHAEGVNTQAIGDYSHAEGDRTQAIGYTSHAEGYATQAIGEYSHAEGYFTTAIGNYSHAEGIGTIASGSFQLAIGGYNAQGDDKSTFILGGGGTLASRRTAARFVQFDSSAERNPSNSATTGSWVLTQVSESLDFADDTTAAAAGVPLGGLYHSSGTIKIRLV